MNLCDVGHDEVCYEGRHCPACTVAQEKDDEISQLNERIVELQSQVQELENQETE